MSWEVLHTFGEKAKSVVAIAAVVGMLLSGAWYIFRLDNKIQTLEAQVQAIAISPTITPSMQSHNAASATVADSSNPLDRACADLANKAAALETAERWTASHGIQELMKTMRCGLPR